MVMTSGPSDDISPVFHGNYTRLQVICMKQIEVR
jgi:hypothetical protein